MRDPALKEMLVHTVDVSHVTGRDRYGTPTYTTTLAVPALVQWKQRVVVTPAGENVTARGYVHLGTLTGVEAGDEVAHDGESLYVIAVERLADERGDHHERVSFQ